MLAFLDYLNLTSSQLGYAWLIASLIFLLLEIGTPGLFFFVAFSIGCMLTSLFAFLDYGIQLQCITFIIISLTSFIIFKKIFSSKNKIEENFKRNVFALLGQTVIVYQTIYPSKNGYVKVKGDFLPAKTENNIQLDAGKSAIVVRIEGNCLIVTSY